MDNGLWALVGVGVGTLLNLLIWFVQFRARSRRDDRATAYGKLEELARILTRTDEIVRNAITQSMVAPDLVALWKEKTFWADLNLIQARIIVSIYFHDALDLFDQMQIPLLEFSNTLKLLMERGGFEDRSSLGQFYDKFASARMPVLDRCQKLLRL